MSEKKYVLPQRAAKMLTEEKKKALHVAAARKVQTKAATHKAKVLAVHKVAATAPKAHTKAVVAKVFVHTRL